MGKKCRSCRGYLTGNFEAKHPVLAPQGDVEKKEIRKKVTP